MMTLLVVALNLIMVSLWWDMEMKMDRTTGWLRTGLLRDFVMCNGSEEALCMASRIRIEGCMHVCGSRPLVELYFPSYGKVDECYENLSG